MKNDFNTAAPDPNVRLVFLPAHTAHVFDALSYRDDGMQGRLSGVSEDYINLHYYSDVQVPAQTVAFTVWQDLPYGMADDTRALLKKPWKKKTGPNWTAAMSH